MREERKYKKRSIKFQTGFSNGILTLPIVWD